MNMKNGINLLPEDVVRKRLIRKVRTGLVAFGVFYAVVLGGVFAAQRMDIGGKKAALSAVEAKGAALLSKDARHAELGRTLAEVKRLETELTQKINTASGFSGKKVAWAHVLKKLSADVPEGVWLRAISTSETDSALKRVRIAGSAVSNRPVAEFISTLENSGIYKDLSLTYTQKREAASGIVYDFEIFMDLKKTEETVHEW